MEKTIAMVFKVLWLFFCMVFTVVVDLFLFMFSIKSVMIHTCYFYVAETMLYATLMYAVFITNK